MLKIAYQSKQEKHMEGINIKIMSRVSNKQQIDISLRAFVEKNAICLITTRAST